MRVNKPTIIFLAEITKQGNLSLTERKLHGVVGIVPSSGTMPMPGCVLIKDGSKQPVPGVKSILEILWCYRDGPLANQHPLVLGAVESSARSLMDLDRKKAGGPALPPASLCSTLLG